MRWSFYYRILHKRKVIEGTAGFGMRCNLVISFCVPSRSILDAGRLPFAKSPIELKALTTARSRHNNLIPMDDGHPVFGLGPPSAQGGSSSNERSTAVGGKDYNTQYQ